MGLSIANNVSSLNAQHNLGKASSNLAKSTERLSSGLKVNRGADGPAALVISEKQRAQIAGLQQAIDNADKATAVVQTAEGALNEINNLLVKVRSLALDSANAEYDKLLRWVPDLRVEPLDASHWVQVDEPEAVNRHLLAFLKEEGAG